MLNTEPPYRKLSHFDAMNKIANEDLDPCFPRDTSDHCLEFTKSCLQRNALLRPTAKDLLLYRFISDYNKS